MLKKNRNKEFVSDLELEKNRYDERARDELQMFSIDKSPTTYYSEFISPIFDKYYELICIVIKPGMRVLEIGAGTGAHTKILIDSGAEVTAQDISRVSLDVLRSKIKGTVNTLTSNMEFIPLKDKTFDCIVCCNVLSYGNPCKVNQEIFRLLKPGGSLIIMDSLNLNYIYRLNRMLHYLKDERTKSTLKRIPNLNRIKQFSTRFESSKVYYFGSYFWVIFPIKFLLGRSIALKINQTLEKIKPSGSGAFKFIFVGQKFTSRSN
jgi:SAM-dependent methyltransferase